MSSSQPEEIPAEEIVDVLKAKGEKNERSKSRKKEIRSVEGLLKSMNNLTIDAKLKVSELPCYHHLTFKNFLKTQNRHSLKSMLNCLKKTVPLLLVLKFVKGTFKYC